jgi:DNA-binding XRE family transcriptional regulator
MQFCVTLQKNRENDMTGATKLRLVRIATDKSAATVARDLKIAPATYRAYERGDNRTPMDVAEKIAAYFKKPISEVFGGEPDTPETFSSTRSGNRGLQILGSARDGKDGFNMVSGAAVMSFAHMPGSLVDVTNAYAVYVDDTSMEPRYFPGEILHCDPHKPAREGDFVVIHMADQDDGSIFAVIKRFIGRDDTGVRVEQYNPPKKNVYPTHHVKAVHVVVGAAY